MTNIDNQLQQSLFVAFAPDEIKNARWYLDGFLFGWCSLIESATEAVGFENTHMYAKWEASPESALLLRLEVTSPEGDLHAKTIRVTDEPKRAGEAREDGRVAARRMFFEIGFTYINQKQALLEKPDENRPTQTL